MADKQRNMAARWKPLVFGNHIVSKKLSAAVDHYAMVRGPQG